MFRKMLHRRPVGTRFYYRLLFYFRYTKPTLENFCSSRIVTKQISSRCDGNSIVAKVLANDVIFVYGILGNFHQIYIYSSSRAKKNNNTKNTLDSITDADQQNRNLVKQKT